MSAIQVNKFFLPPTDLIPNSPRPLLQYKKVLQTPANASHCDPVEVYDLFNDNGWKVSWIFRYGATQKSHFHSQAHECMAVLSGAARIRFGVADTSADLDENTHGTAWEAGGVELDAEAGDVFVIPAGVAHKTYNTQPSAEFALLTPGRGHGLGTDDPKAALKKITLDGFTMMGAYSGGDWDFVEAGGNYEQVWAVPKPECDPVLGKDERGLGST
ncbi:hypothetical protein K4F52_010189 [Lecanicillium sp. MT-2017a]|nr:hypothetical protein K4F52_010189 [Lecanicillium sp. MT-2017a]